MNVDGGNAVEMLLLLAGLTLVPALIFTTTGFTRILIVLGFVRTGLGTPTAPPNQVLIGIALFLTLFVMAPTLEQMKIEALDPLTADKIDDKQALIESQDRLIADRDATIAAQAQHIQDLIAGVGSAEAR